MRKILIAFGLMAVLVIGVAAQTSAPAGIRSVDFSNYSYRLKYDDSANLVTVKLNGGKFEDSEQGLIYELFGAPAYGDVNGDKSEDAVVEIKLSSTGASYRAFEVQAYTFQNSAAKMIASLNSDQILKDYRRYYPKADLHYAGTNPPKVQNGIVTIEALTEGSFASPKYTAIFNYRLRAGKFVLIGKPVRKPFKGA